MSDENIRREFMKKAGGIGVPFLGATDRSALVALGGAGHMAVSAVSRCLLVARAGRAARSAATGVSVANSIAGHLNSSELRHDFPPQGIGSSRASLSNLRRWTGQEAITNAGGAP